MQREWQLSKVSGALANLRMMSLTFNNSVSGMCTAGNVDILIIHSEKYFHLHLLEYIFFRYL